MEQSQPLLGVKAYVDVRCKHASLAVSEELRNLGATIYDKLLPMVTHVVFKDGSKVTETKAKRFGAHVVSVTWVESCNRERRRVAEHHHKLCSASAGKKKPSSMLPKSFDQELQRVSAKLEREKNKKKDIRIPSPLKIVGDRINLNKYIQAPRTPPSMQEKLDKLRKRQASASLQSGSRSMKPSGLVESPSNDALGTSPVLRSSQKSKEVIVPCTVAKPRLDPSDEEVVPETQNRIVPETPQTWRSNSHLLLTPENKLFPTLDLDSSEDSGPDGGVEMLDPPSPVLEWDVAVNSFLNERLSSSQSSPRADERKCSAVAKGSVGEMSDMMDSSDSVEPATAKNDSVMDVDEVANSRMASSRRSTLCHDSSRVRATPHDQFVPPGKRKRFMPPFLKPVSEVSANLPSKSPVCADLPIASPVCASKTNSACETHPRKNRKSVADILSLHLKTVNTKQSEQMSNSPNLNSGRTSHKATPSELDNLSHTPMKAYFSNSKCKVKSRSKLNDLTSDVAKAGDTSQDHMVLNSSTLSSIEISQLNISEKSPRTPGVARKSLAKSRKSKVSRNSKLSLKFGANDKENCRATAGLGDSTPAEQTVPTPQKKNKRVLSDVSNQSFDNTEFYTRVKKSNQKVDQGPVSVDDEDEVWDFDSLAPADKNSKLAASRQTKTPGDCEMSIASTGTSSKSSCGRGGGLGVGGANIVLTSFHSGDRSMVKSVIKKLGGYHIDVTVNDNTTHVVCGDDRRTVNVMKGISRGCWVVSSKWVLSSLEASRWLVNEKDFVMSQVFPGASPQRRQGLLDKQNKLLASVGPFYVTHNTNPPPQDLTHLIKLNGGQVVRTRRACQLVIGAAADVNTSRIVVKESWLLDCIIHQRLLDHRPYRWTAQNLSPDIDNDASDIFEL